MPLSDAFSYLPSLDKIERHGAAGPKLQARWRFSSGDGGERLVVQLRGAVEEIVENTKGPGSVSLPAGIPLTTSKDIICDTCDVEGEEGGYATLTLAYRLRNARETTADVLAGLHRRDVSARWVERQETIEHWAAREISPAAAEGASGSEGESAAGFDGALFQAWLSEPDAAARLAYKVVAADEEIELGGLTKAVAERYAMGVQYAAVHMMQVEVDEVWRETPPVSGKCNVRIPGIPQNHKPLFGLDGFKDRFTFVRALDGVRSTGGGWFARRVVYLCVPGAMKPSAPPTGWGDSPVDGLLYPPENGD